MGIDRAESKRSVDETKRDLRRQERETEESALMATIVLEQVLKDVADVPNFLQLKIRPLWKSHFRANVYVGTDLAGARISHSYFLVTDEEGVITQSAPPISSIRPKVTN